LVQRGQFLERPALISVGKWVLEGLSHRGDKRPPLLVVPPPPDEGGSMDHVVCAELAWAATQAGHPSLRFNFKGVGASQGRRGDQLLDDARAALQLCVDNWNATPFVAAIGGSARIASQLEGAGLCLISPPEIEGWGSQVWVVVGEKDLPRGGSVATHRMRVIPDADKTFQKNLPMVGHVVSECLKLAETLQ
jgi:hypothetical protein